MSAAKERILRAVRRSLRRAGRLPESVRDGLDRRVAAPIPSPALAEDPVSLFVRKANAVHARVSTVPTLAEVSEVVVTPLAGTQPDATPTSILANSKSCHRRRYLVAGIA